MNHSADEWSSVKVEAVFNGSDAQARNVLQMALNDIAALAAERDRTERNRDMWKGQCERQADKLRAFNGEEPTNEMARAMVAEYRKIYPRAGWPALPEAKRLIRAAVTTPKETTNG